LKEIDDGGVQVATGGGFAAGEIDVALRPREGDRRHFRCRRRREIDVQWPPLSGAAAARGGRVAAHLLEFRWRPTLSEEMEMEDAGDLKG
jgi:hypothetical protein